MPVPVYWVRSLVRQGSGLAQGFAERECRRGGMVLRADLRAHRDAQPGIAGVGARRRYARALLSEEQDIVGQEAELISRYSRLGAEQHQPARTDRGSERREAGMARDLDMIDIVHRGPADALVVPFE